MILYQHCWKCGFYYGQNSYHICDGLSQDNPPITVNLPFISHRTINMENTNPMNLEAGKRYLLKQKKPDYWNPHSLEEIHVLENYQGAVKIKSPGGNPYWSLKKYFEDKYEIYGELPSNER